jgi:hypothetical protein
MLFSVAVSPPILPSFLAHTPPLTGLFSRAKRKMELLQFYAVFLP